MNIEAEVAKMMTMTVSELREKFHLMQLASWHLGEQHES
jgi:hypothetical protein